MIEALGQSKDIKTNFDKENIQKEIYKDFYLSFRHSQGSEQLQMDLFFFLIDYYQNKFSPDQIGDINKIFNYFHERLVNFKIPIMHKDVDRITMTARKMADVFLSYWIRYKENPTTTLDLIPTISRQIISRDLDYVSSINTNARPNRFEGFDSRESFFRSYVIEEKGTSSVAFDFMYSLIRDLYHLDSSKIVISDKTVFSNTPKRFKKGLSQLKHAWEKVHPDQKFFPVKV